MFDLDINLQHKVLQKPGSNMMVNMGYPTDHQLPLRAKQKVLRVPSWPKSRPAQSQPVDPQELARRLYIVLAEEEAHSERRRRARADANRPKQTTSKSQPKRSHDPTEAIQGALINVGDETTQRPDWSTTQRGSLSKEKRNREDRRKSGTSSTQGGEDEHENKATYRHVPQVAASQFTRTTTVETSAEKGSLHTLSKQAMKFHLDSPNAIPTLAANCPSAPHPCENTKALKRAQSMRERHYKRYPIDETSLPRKGELDMRLYPLSPRQTIQNNARSVTRMEDDVKDTKRMSTGSFLGRSEPHLVEPFELAAVLLSPEKPEIVGNPNDHRVDWSQSDEPIVANLVAQSSSPQPELRRPESKWKLRSRLGSFGRHNRDDKLPTPPEEMAAHDLSPKSPISGFFARFKR